MKSVLPIRRILAFIVDWLVLALWGSVVFGIAMVLSGGKPQPFSSPWVGQLVSLLVMTLPFVLYLALCESSSRQASLGKRLCRLKVTGPSGERLPFKTCFQRNVMKFIPWEFGHAVAHHATLGSDGGEIWLWGLLLLSVLGIGWWLGALFLRGRTPYDQWVGACVVPVKSLLT